MSTGEILRLIDLIYKQNIVSEALMDELINDLLANFETSKLNYNDIYNLVSVLYVNKINIPELYNSIAEYYVVKGYDDDEFALMGNSNSCKFFKAISESCPNLTSDFSHMFNDSAFKFIKDNYRKFTTIQLKRAIDYLTKMEYFIHSENEKTQQDIQEIEEYRNQKVQQSVSKSYGIDLEMKNEETEYVPEDQNDHDPIFEQDNSDEENDVDFSKISLRKKKELLEQHHSLESVFSGIDLNKVNQSHVKKKKLDKAFSDPKLNRLANLVDESYMKYGKMIIQK